MAFAIEVPAETNPLTEILLIHTLRSASSSNPHQIQTGTKQLAQWEKSEHFYVHLHSAFLDRRLPLETRHLAIIQLKNGIDKYWRRTALNAVSKEDKAIIRSRLIDGALNEPDDRLALQNAIVIAKIARFEFPNDWPDCISSIVARLRHASEAGVALVAARSLLLLLHIVKELSTARLQRSRQNLQAATPELLKAVVEHYRGLITPLTDNVFDEELWATAQPKLVQTLLALKIVRRLLVTGYENPNRDSFVSNVWEMLIFHLSQYIYISTRTTLQFKTLIDKHMLQVAKCHHEMSREHPAAFVLLPVTLDLVTAYWSIVKDLGERWGSRSAVSSTDTSAKIGHGGDVNEQSTTEKVTLRAMLVIRACIKMVYNPAHTFKYRHPQDKEERAQAVDLVKSKILTEDFVREVMNVIVTKFFVFRDSDLREWEEEPEEWEKREEAEGEDFEFSIRPCAEKLFLDLAINYKDILVQPLLTVFESVASSEDILLKDSIYTAVGLAAPVLVDHLNIDPIIQNNLVREISSTQAGGNIMRRRTAIFLGQWISVRIGSQSKTTVYQIFQHILQRGQPLNDQVVRVTAGRQLKHVIDDWDFAAEQFMPLAASILDDLMQLIGESELMETKLAILNTISTLVERLEHQISPFANQIVNILPSLWDQSGEEHLMKQAILTLLTRLLTSMKAQSERFHGLVLPIIENAVKPDSETQVYLLEDAMDLWASVLAQTRTDINVQDPVSQQLVSLIQYLFSIFDLGSDSLRKGLEIAESYTLVVPSHILSDAARREMLISLAGLIGSLKPDANGLVFVLLETIIRAAVKLNGEAGVSQLISDMHSTGVLDKILLGLRGSWKAHCTTGPRAEAPPVDGIVETDYFAILARLILGSTSSFCQMVQVAAPSESTEGHDLGSTMDWLLEEWFSHFENIGDPSRRKLMCLALTKLLETGQRWILLKLQSLMTMWTDVMREFYDSSTDQPGDALVFQEPENVPEGPEEPEELRRKAISRDDPVHTIQTADWIKHHLQQTMAQQPNFQEEWIANVDKDVVQGFSSLGII